MNQSDKITIKAQLQSVSAQLQATGQMAMTGATQPILTPMGPASGAGLVQMGAALNQQAAILQELVKQIMNIVDKV
jgi:hypothetical protein